MVIVHRCNRRSFDWFIIFSMEESKEGVRKMKLSEYIFKEYNKSVSALSADDIEKWIFHWYVDEYDRRPPVWLLGKKKK